MSDQVTQGVVEHGSCRQRFAEHTGDVHRSARLLYAIASQRVYAGLTQLWHGVDLGGESFGFAFASRGGGTAPDDLINLLQQFIREAPSDTRPTLAQLKQAFKRQMFILFLDEERAVNTLPKLLPEMDLRVRALDLVRRIALPKGKKAA